MSAGAEVGRLQLAMAETAEGEQDVRHERSGAVCGVLSGASWRLWTTTKTPREGFGRGMMLCHELT